ncbi:MAG: hypothetical protein LBH66_03535 [Oscillospiraceae bacterium]|jgi:hypothetical protein|nr:hypothetical protein [Oscillospiraceae bacterium]
MEDPRPINAAEAEPITTETNQPALRAETTAIIIPAAIIETEPIASSNSAESGKARGAKKPSRDCDAETVLKKVEENQLALETRLSLECKAIAERADFRFNRMESFQKEAVDETRRAARDVRALAIISVIASIAVAVISFIR